MRFEDRYRTVPEARIVDMLVLIGWVHGRDDPTAASRARDALAGWVGVGLPCRAATTGAWLFDPVEVWSFMKQFGRSGRDPAFHQRRVATARRHVTDLAMPPMPDRRFTIEFERTFDTSRMPREIVSRFRLPLPLESRHADRSVELLGDATERGPVTLHASKLELRCRPSGERLTISARTGFTAPQTEVADEDLAPYLRPREDMAVVSARVQDLAQALAGPGATVAQAVRAFWSFLIEEFVCTPVHYDQINPAAPCDWVLDAGCYDCRLGAALFVALCRARDIPARLIGGYFLYRCAPTNHFWAEYRCPERGWTPVDFFGWDLSGGGEDPVWRDRFFGQLEPRLVTEILPLAFVGAPGVPIPDEWHMLQTAVDGGVEIAVTALDGRPIYTDTVRLIE